MAEGSHDTCTLELYLLSSLKGSTFQLPVKASRQGLRGVVA